MSENSVNWSDLKKSADDATKPAPEGDYIVEVKKADSTTAQTSGNPMYKLQASITEGPAAGKTVFTNVNVTLGNAFALSIFFRNMAAFGMGDDYFAAGPSHEQVCADLVGRRAIWSLGIRQWQGVDRNEVTGMKALEGPNAQAPLSATSSAIPTPGAVSVGAGPAVGAMPPTPQIPTPTTAAPPTPFDV